MEQTLRQKAIAWWNSYPNRDKLMDDYFIEREESSLTGREIQSIYESEHPTNSEAKNYVGVRFTVLDDKNSDEYRIVDENGDLLPKESSDILPLDNAATPKSYSEAEVLKILGTFNRSTLKLQEYKLGNSYDVKDWWEDFKQKTK